MEINKEIRTQINTVDTEVNNLIELMDDKHPLEEELVNILNSMTELQNEITELQENQGWI